MLSKFFKFISPEKQESIPEIPTFSFEQKTDQLITTNKQSSEFVFDEPNTTNNQPVCKKCNDGIISNPSSTPTGTFALQTSFCNCVRGRQRLNLMKD